MKFHSFQKSRSERDGFDDLLHGRDAAAWALLKVGKSLSRILLGLFTALVFACLPGPAAYSQNLTDFRQPNELETAYIGVAAQIVDPSLCEKISEKALYRGRKPMLARSRCYYYIAINTGMLTWCDKVQEVPITLGMMNWLEPKRCRHQVKRIRGNSVYKVKFDYAALFTKMGYRLVDVPKKFRAGNRTNWPEFFNFVIANRDHDANRKFSSLLAGLPDFNVIAREQDRKLHFTHKEEVYEFVSMASRGLKLCLQGHGSDNCSPRNYRKMRERLNKVRNSTKAPAVKEKKTVQYEATTLDDGDRLALRKPTNLESAYYNFALGMGNPSICDKISPDTLAVGWTTEPGLLFMPLRSICLTAVASITEKAELCDRVVPLARGDLDGADLTPARCREILQRKAPSPHRPTLSADWKEALQALGFTETERQSAQKLRPDEKIDWKGLALWSMEESAPYNALLRGRLAAAPVFLHGDTRVDRTLAYTEAALQKHLYQLTLIRFHCSLPQDAASSRKNAADAPKPLSAAGKFALTDHKGRAVNDRTYQGKFMLVYFGYTHCPDLCPTDLSNMIDALNILGDAQTRNVEPIFITLDPRRDTIEHMAEYVDLFDPRLQGLTGTVDEVRKAARGYKVYFYSGMVDGTYVVDHTAYTYLVDPEGRHLAYFEHGAGTKEMAATIKRHVSSRSD